MKQKGETTPKTDELQTPNMYITQGVTFVFHCTTSLYELQCDIEW